LNVFGDVVGSPELPLPDEVAGPICFHQEETLAPGWFCGRTQEQYRLIGFVYNQVDTFLVTFLTKQFDIIILIDWFEIVLRITRGSNNDHQSGDQECKGNMVPTANHHFSLVEYFLTPNRSSLF